MCSSRSFLSNRLLEFACGDDTDQLNVLTQVTILSLQHFYVITPAAEWMGNAVSIFEGAVEGKAIKKGYVNRRLTSTISQ
jgi:hypothetical protein